MGQSIVALALLFISASALAAGGTAGLDTAKIEELTGLKGKLNDKEGVFKVSLPRKDLAVTAAGVKLTPGLGLTAWTAFKRVGKDVAIMGDLCSLKTRSTR